MQIYVIVEFLCIERIGFQRRASSTDKFGEKVGPAGRSQLQPGSVPSGKKGRNRF